MANKTYTAQEMRNCADNCDWRINPCVAEMLRQAADLMEREEREKKYEYTTIAKTCDGEVFLDTEHFSTLEDAMKNAKEGFYGYDVVVYKRREVGEWEEVNNER